MTALSAPTLRLASRILSASSLYDARIVKTLGWLRKVDEPLKGAKNSMLLRAACSSASMLLVAEL